MTEFRVGRHTGTAEDYDAARLISPEHVEYWNVTNIVLLIELYILLLFIALFIAVISRLFASQTPNRIHNHRLQSQSDCDCFRSDHVTICAIA
jgi:hypothetical protein